MVKTIESVLEKYGIDQRDAADAIRICCPFCGNKKFKVYIYRKSRKVICYRCGEHGHVWKFLKAYGVKDPGHIAKSVAVEEKELVPESPSLPAEAKPIDGAGSLLAQKAMMFLLKRGLDHRDIVKYKMQYCLDGPYAGNIIIPIYNEDNTLTGWQGRRFWLPGHKSVNPTNANTSGQLFCMNHLKDKKYLIIVEGPFDAIVLNKKLEGTDFGAVALLGHSISRQQTALIGYVIKPEAVWIMLDPDVVAIAYRGPSGSFNSRLEDQKKIADELHRIGIQDVKLCDLKYKDPDQLDGDELACQLASAKQSL